MSNGVMNKKPLIALAAVSLAASAAVGVAPAASAAPKSTLVVTQLPAQVRLIPGEHITLSLSTNKTTGYTWSTKVTGKTSAVKVFQGVYVAPASTDGMVGVPGTTTWDIEAKAVGTATVNVIATSPGGTAEAPQKLTIIVMKKQ